MEAEEVICFIKEWELSRNRKKELNAEKAVGEAYSSIFFLFTENIIFFLTIWLVNSYAEVCMDQILYKIRTFSPGAERSVTVYAVIIIGTCSLVAKVMETGLYALLSGRLKVTGDVEI